MADNFILTEDSAKILQRVLDDYKRSRRNGPGHTPEAEPGYTPDVYVARTPGAGIPALRQDLDTGTGTLPVGTGSPSGQGHTPGGATCQIFRTLYAASTTPNLIAMGFTRKVLNLSTTAVPPNAWVIVWRDKYGDWYTRDEGGESNSLTIRDNVPSTPNRYPDVTEIMIDDPRTSSSPSGSSAMYITDLGGAGPGGAGPGELIEIGVLFQLSITCDASGLKLVNDIGTPGNNKFYGTNASGVKGWYAASGTGTVTSVTGVDSINGTITGSGNLNLVNDTASPGVSKVYGTKGTGVRGWMNVVGTGSSIVVSGDLDLKLDGDSATPGNFHYYATKTGSKGWQTNLAGSVSGSRSAGNALTNLLTALATAGIITDSTSA